MLTCVVTGGKVVCSTFFITVEADDIFIRLSSIKEGNVSMEGKWEKKKGRRLI